MVVKKLIELVDCAYKNEQTEKQSVIGSTLTGFIHVKYSVLISETMIVSESQETPTLLFVLQRSSKRPARNIEADVSHSLISFTKKKKKKWKLSKTSPEWLKEDLENAFVSLSKKDNLGRRAGFEKNKELALIAANRKRCPDKFSVKVKVDVEKETSIEINQVN